jgi:hypothetical protein
MTSSARERQPTVPCGPRTTCRRRASLCDTTLVIQSRPGDRMACPASPGPATGNQTRRSAGVALQLFGDPRRRNHRCPRLGQRLGADPPTAGLPGRLAPPRLGISPEPSEGGAGFDPWRSRSGDPHGEAPTGADRSTSIHHSLPYEGHQHQHQLLADRHDPRPPCGHRRRAALRHWDRRQRRHQCRSWVTCRGAPPTDGRLKSRLVPPSVRHPPAVRGWRSIRTVSSDRIGQTRPCSSRKSSATVTGSSLSTCTRASASVRFWVVSASDTPLSASSTSGVTASDWISGRMFCDR